jgi:hypothetical protein
MQGMCQSAGHRLSVIYRARRLDKRSWLFESSQQFGQPDSFEADPVDHVFERFSLDFASDSRRGAITLGPPLCSESHGQHRLKS